MLEHEMGPKKSDAEVPRETARDAEALYPQFMQETGANDGLNAEADLPAFMRNEGVQPPELLEETGMEKVAECKEIAQSIFTPEVLQRWQDMGEGERAGYMDTYARAISAEMGVDYNGIQYFQDPRILGVNRGDGFVLLNRRLISDPGQVISAIDTLAHETRHQYQNEAIRDPERFGYTQNAVVPWAEGMRRYTTEGASAYDPYGYNYNPVEIDARRFGEAICESLYPVNA